MMNNSRKIIHGSSAISQSVGPSNNSSTSKCSPSKPNTAAAQRQKPQRVSTYMQETATFKQRAAPKTLQHTTPKLDNSPSSQGELSPIKAENSRVFSQDKQILPDLMKTPTLTYKEGEDQYMVYSDQMLLQHLSQENLFTQQMSNQADQSNKTKKEGTHRRTQSYNSQSSQSSATHKEKRRTRQQRMKSQQPNLTNVSFNTSFQVLEEEEPDSVLNKSQTIGESPCFTILQQKYQVYQDSPHQTPFMQQQKLQQSSSEYEGATTTDAETKKANRKNQNSIVAYKRDASLEKLLEKSPSKGDILHFAKVIAAKKIQKMFRAYILWQRIKQRALEYEESKKVSKLKKILAAKVIVKFVKKWLLRLKGRKQRLRMIRGIVKLQRWYHQVRFQRKIRRAKAKLLAYSMGWRIRRCLSILENKIKDYVKEDRLMLKSRIRKEFLKSFETLMRNQLYIRKNYEQHLKEQSEQNSQNKPRQSSIESQSKKQIVAKGMIRCQSAYKPLLDQQKRVEPKHLQIIAEAQVSAYQISEEIRETIRGTMSKKFEAIKEPFIESVPISSVKRVGVSLNQDLNSLLNDISMESVQTQPTGTNPSQNSSIVKFRSRQVQQIQQPFPASSASSTSNTLRVSQKTPSLNLSAKKWTPSKSPINAGSISQAPYTESQDSSRVPKLATKKRESIAQTVIAKFKVSSKADYLSKINPETALSPSRNNPKSPIHKQSVSASTSVDPINKSKLLSPRTQNESKGTSPQSRVRGLKSPIRNISAQIDSEARRENILKIQSMYKKTFSEMESILDHIVETELAALDSTLQQNQTSQGYSKSIMSGQKAKIMLKYNKLHADAKDFVERLSHLNSRMLQN